MISLYSKIAYTFYKKNQYDMEPIHVFQLNFMIVSTLSVIFPAMASLDQLTGFIYQPGGSCYYYFPLFFAYFCFNTDLVMMQVDRFLAVYWNMKYASRITYKLALRFCIGSKVLAAVVTMMVGFLDLQYSTCAEEYAFIHLKLVNIYLVSIPNLGSGVILLVVLTYMALTMVNLENKVQPVVSLPSVPTVSQHLEEGEVDEMQENNKNGYKVERNIEDPHVFERVQLQESKELQKRKREEPNFSCIVPQVPNSEIFLVAKRALTMSLITLVLFSIIIPKSILAIIHAYSGDIETYLWQYRISAPFRIFSHFLHQGLLLKKIDKI